MKFETIFLANLAEVARPLVRLMRKARREGEIWEDHGLCDRFLFSDRDNSLLVTPLPIDPDFFQDSCKILALENVKNLYPAKIGESLCEAILKDQKLLKKLKEAIADNPRIKIISYVASREFGTLIQYLRKCGYRFAVPEMPDAKDQWTQAYFGSKAGFRQTLGELDGKIPVMPEGKICHKLAEVKKFAGELFNQGSAGVVIKTNRGLAGAGLVILRRAEITAKELPQAITKLWRTESYWRKDPAVVEAYIPPDYKVCGGSPNIELRIADHRIEPLYVCGMRISKEGVFQGVEIGKGAVPRGLTRQLTTVATEIGKHLLRAGYRGFFELDWVAAADGRLYPIEANLRRTGGTHVFETGRRLLGEDFLLHYYMAARNLAPAPALEGKTYREVRAKLGAWLYPLGGRKEGVMLTILNLLSTGRCGYLVIGKNAQRVHEIEHELERLLTD